MGSGIFGVLFVAAFAVQSFMGREPKDAYGMVRYALPHMHRGTLKVGSECALMSRMSRWMALAVFTFANEPMSGAGAGVREFT